MVARCTNMFDIFSSIFRARNQPAKARLLPLVLSVVVVSFGCFIHGSSVVFGGIAVVGLNAASKTMKANSSSSELGFNWDNTHDSAWLGKTDCPHNNRPVLTFNFSSWNRFHRNDPRQLGGCSDIK